MSTEKFLLHDNQIFKQSYYNELNFFSVKNSSLYFVIKRLSELETHGTLYKDNNQNVIEENVSLNIVDDARDLITKENANDWLISVNQTKDVWHTRDVYHVDSSGPYDNDSPYNHPSYFAINLSDTPLGNIYEEGYDLDITLFSKYKLYHKEVDGNYYLIQKTENIK